MLLMTWIATIFYFLQTDFIAKTFRRWKAAPSPSPTWICSSISAPPIILIFGLGRILQRFGVTASLVLTPS